MATSPTQRTLNEMRKRGYVCDVVEKTINTGEIVFKRDLFGFIDVLCIGLGETVAVQATSNNGGNVTGRIKKIRSDELRDKLEAVKLAGWTVVVHGWRKEGRFWRLREEVIHAATPKWEAIGGKNV